MSKLMLHSGAVPMNVDQLSAMKYTHPRHCIPLTPTHHPLPHYEVSAKIKQSVQKFASKDYSIVSEEYCISGKYGTECFGAFGLRKHGYNNPDYEIFYGWRHSNARLFSLRCGLADRFFICDNMSMHIDNECAGSKHTLNIDSKFQERVDELTRRIIPMDIALHERNNNYKGFMLTREESDHMIMECVRQGSLQKTRINLVDKEYRKPSFKYNTSGKSLLDLKHAMTHVMKGEIYSSQIKRGMKMHNVFDAYVQARA